MKDMWLLDSNLNRGRSGGNVISPLKKSNTLCNSSFACKDYGHVALNHSASVNNLCQYHLTKITNSTMEKDPSFD